MSAWVSCFLALSRSRSLGHGVLGGGDVCFRLRNVRLGLLLLGIEPVEGALERVHLVLEILDLALHLNLLGLAIVAEGDVVHLLLTEFSEHLVHRGDNDVEVTLSRRLNHRRHCGHAETVVLVREALDGLERHVLAVSLHCGALL